ncbi:MAG: hypothetical protein FJ386_08940 [Verrucomicrobia bacterium]|nr:hypothetical protein [Verrucomicrobiota bacterium]
MRTKRSLLLTALFLAATAPAAEQTATVKDNRVNIRGQATLNSEVITQLKKGETVTVLEQIPVKAPKAGEPRAWLRIALPANTPVWVFNSFISNNAVHVPKLNVRAGPGENYSIVARMEKGAPVKPLRTSGAWMEIEPPPGASAFVAAETVIRKSGEGEATASSTSSGKSGVRASGSPTAVRPGSDPSISGGRVDPSTTPAPLSEPTLVRVEPIRTNPLTTVPSNPALLTPASPAAALPATAPVTTPVTTTPAVPPVTSATPVVATAPSPTPGTPTSAAAIPAAAAKSESAAATAPAGGEVYYQIQVPPPKRSIWSRIFGWGGGQETGEQRDAAKRAQAPPPKKLAVTSTNTPPPVVETEPGPPRVVTREGIVRKVWNVQAPSNWELADIYTGRTINYLYSTNESVPWASIKGRVILVTGEEMIDRRWPRMPVLRIETLKTVE